MTKNKITVFIEDTNLIDLGKILIGKTEQGICACLIGHTTQEVCQEFDQMFVGFDVKVISRIEEKEEYEGDFTQLILHLDNLYILKDTNIDFCIGTDFQKKVWEAIREIPLGETRTYSEIANRIGYPKAVRAVGSACGKNPITFIVPCHRVVNKSYQLVNKKTLGKYRYGVQLKNKLLMRENQYVH